jgi:tetratricopeptide (TPR) repeat protein
MDKNNSLREQIGISPDEMLEIAAVGSIFYRQGNLEKAKDIFEGLVELDSDMFEIQSCLASFFTKVREDDRALLHIDRAISLNPENVAPYVNRAEINIRRFNLEKVVADISKVIELDPKIRNPDANRARTMLLGIYDAFQKKGWIKKRLEKDIKK